MPCMMKKDNFKLDVEQQIIMINTVAHCETNQWFTVLKIDAVAKCDVKCDVDELVRVMK